ncbi:hypothetical protein FXO38_34146 [Capsicum annuum]|nr:hypothetical protein FXO38_34146 [Capsicum annuum]
MEKQQSFRNGAMEKQKSFKGIMEKQKNFRIVMERQMSFGGGERKRDSNVLERILFTVLSILKSESFSRDCLVAAGVTFCVALHVCLSPEELGLFIMEGIFNESFIVCPKFAFADVVEKISFKGNLIDELSKFSSLSRLCLVWVILTTVSRTVLYIGFVVSNDNFGSFMDSGDSRKSIKMILYDAILLELCSFCENPIDSHFSFHALAVMQICLQQVKTSMVNKNGSVDVNYDPISEDMGTRLLQVVWNNLENPLSQTVKQVHLIFLSLLRHSGQSTLGRDC